MSIDTILCFVTGFRYSGATYLSKVLSSHPRIMSGYEGGFLLVDKMSEFEGTEQYSYLTKSADEGYWGLKEKNAKKILNAKNHKDAYNILKKKAGSQGDKKVKKAFRSASYFVDKCTDYIYNLVEVMNKTSKPFIVVNKDIESLYASYKKRGYTIDYLEQHHVNDYAKARKAIRDAKNRFPERLLIVDYHELVNNFNEQVKKIYEFLDIWYNNKFIGLENYFDKTGLPEDIFYDDVGGFGRTPQDKQVTVTADEKERLQDLETRVLGSTVEYVDNTPQKAVESSEEDSKSNSSRTKKNTDKKVFIIGYHLNTDQGLAQRIKELDGVKCLDYDPKFIEAVKYNYDNNIRLLQGYEDYNVYMNMASDDGSIHLGEKYFQTLEKQYPNSLFVLNLMPPEKMAQRAVDNLNYKKIKEDRKSVV